MGKIFCLIGKSNSGKDTIFNLLKEDKSLSLRPVVPYTTRPKRSYETEGIEYNFISEEIMDQYSKIGKIIEKREYNTVNGKWYYCTIDNDQLDLKAYNYLVISTLDAYQSLQAYFGADAIFPIYIHVDDGIRLQRALDREKKQEQPNYDELCRRFLADSKDFRAERLENSKIDKYYYNNNLTECLRHIKEDIKRIIAT